MSAIRKERTEWLVGLFVFFGLAIMGTLIVQFGRFSDRLQEKYRIEVNFPDASDIREGSPVKFAGQKVGFVAAEPTLNEDFTGVSVLMDIYGDKRIPQGSQFTIGTSGLMGDTYIRVIMPDNPKPVYLADGDQVKGDIGAGLESLQQDAGLVMADIRVAVQDIQIAIESLNRVFEKIETGILGAENLENLNKTFAEIRQTGENLNEATEKLDPLLDEARETVEEAKTAMTKAGTALDKAGNTFDKASEAIEKAEPAIGELEPALAELRETIKNANKAISQVSNGDGVAAALISDSGLRQDLESFVDKLERYGIMGYPKNKPGGDGKSSGKEAESEKESSSSRGFLLRRKR